MVLIHQALVLAVAAFSVTVPVDNRSDQPTRTVKPVAMYAAHQVERYLTEEEVGYVRPGLHVTVESVEITADRHVVVELSLTDDFGQPLDRAGNITPGEVSFGFLLAWYDVANRDYVSYITRPQTSPITGDTAEQASSDSGGTLEDLGLGRVRYTFGTALPADFDGSRTHTIGIYITRDLVDVIDKTYYDNVEHDFRPDGGEVTEVWQAIDNATCNSCHEQLALHGGRRRDVKLCVLCHNKQTWDPDTGNSVDLKQMIHKIHMGAMLPSVMAGTPYQIIGYRQSVHDYSGVLFTQDIRNCVRCHTADSPEGYIWHSRANRDACGSCHDDINWETGDGHAAGAQLDDNACGICHPPEGVREYDTSVMGAHVIPTRSSQLAGLHAEIVDVRNVAPGSMPTVDFRLTNDAGEVVDPAGIDRFSLLVGGPTTDYAEYLRETVSDATVNGELATYTMTTPLPDDATGTWAFSADVYRNVTIDDGSSEGIEVREAAFNPLFYAPVTDGEAEERRTVVELERCNVCHDSLALHGGQRFRIEECVICHNPLEDDSEVRPAEEMPAESIHFKWMIHRIHRGHALENDFTVYGYRSSVHSYNHVGYPGDLRTCEGCHAPGTYGVPLPEGVLATPTPRDWYTPMQPSAAACLSCHSSLDAAAHAYVNYAPFGEACASCHGEDRDHAVAKVHAH